MIEINLLPEELKKKDAIKISLPAGEIQKTLKLAAAGLLVLQILFLVFAFSKRTELGWVNRSIGILKEENKEIAALKTQTQATQTHLHQMETLTGRKFSWTLLLNSLSSSITKGVWLRSFSISDDHKILKLEGSVIGQGQETAYVGRFIKALKEDAVFNSIFEESELSNMAGKKIKDVDVFDFALNCRFKKEML